MINVHDLPVPHLIEVHSAGSTTKAGWILDSEDYQAERSAFNALVQVVSDGLFILEDERDFNFNIHGDDKKEFLEWVLEIWNESTILPDRTSQRIEDLFRRAVQPAHLILKAPARMTKLRAV